MGGGGLVSLHGWRKASKDREESVSRRGGCRHHHSRECYWVTLSTSVAYLARTHRYESMRKIERGRGRDRWFSCRYHPTRECFCVEGGGGSSLTMGGVKQANTSYQVAQHFNNM